MRADPPQRAWMQIRTHALFGLVGERVVISLPGDGHVIVFQERADVLERMPFEASKAADAGPWGGVAELQSLLAGRVPWPGGVVPAGTPRVVAARGGGVQVSIAVAPPSGPGEVRLRFEAERLRRLEWWRGGRLDLELLYDEHVRLGVGWRPHRVRLRIPSTGLRAEIRFDHLEPRSGFGDRDFEVGGNPGRGVWVQRGG